MPGVKIKLLSDRWAADAVFSSGTREFFGGCVSLGALLSPDTNRTGVTLYRTEPLAQKGEKKVTENVG